MAISPKVIQLIDYALAPLIDGGCEISKIKMVVAAGAEIAAEGKVQTAAGPLRIEENVYVPKGRSYLIEDRYQGFAWVR
ncbi:hypothetical protein [Paenibacillus sp. JJ-223]|uniref:hypothetical protein n=1 Tax=Paenibacillus sp. JJ-223 TaxID=2905647 RepID=UPI001F2C1560|nr:hypothetical protein [Paenibacillus sp. JJ-223]CAH1216001.1 hypothetical protein PAECIP111890_04331 [Paenibacillus sp. JJ-223]